MNNAKKCHKCHGGGTRTYRRSESDFAPGELNEYHWSPYYPNDKVLYRTIDCPDCNGTGIIIECLEQETFVRKETEPAPKKNNEDVLLELIEQVLKLADLHGNFTAGEWLKNRFKDFVEFNKEQVSDQPKTQSKKSNKEVLTDLIEETLNINKEHGTYKSIRYLKDRFEELTRFRK